MKQSKMFLPAALLLLASATGCGAGVTGGQTASDKTVTIGWISSLTGPLSSAAVAENRGVKYAVDQINAHGGIGGQQVRLVTRDSQGDPTKAVSAANELTQKDHVDFVIGPVNSGEALPVIPVLARANTPNIVIGTVDELTSPSKYPLAFRVIPTNTQWVTAANQYALKQLDVKKVAILADNTGYGTDTADLAKQLFTKMGGEVTYSGLIDPAQTDVSSDIRKARASGAQAIMVWSAATGLDARIIEARSQAGWHVPVVGHPALASGDTGALLSQKSDWNKVYAVGYRSMSTDAKGNLPASTARFIKEAGPKVLGKNIDYTLWWVAMGYDAVQVIEHAVEKAGGTDPTAVQNALEQTNGLKGVFASYSWGPNNRDGFPQADVVMNEASSFHNGTFKLAPGYK